MKKSTSYLIVFALLHVFAAMALGATYTWVGASGASWQVSTNWSPNRTTPATIDVLQFNGGGSQSATAVPGAQTIGQLIISNSTAVTLTSAAGSLTLSIGSGIAGTDLDVQSGSSLTLSNGGTAFTVTYAGTSTAGSIAGTVTVNAGVTLNVSTGISPTTAVSGTIVNAGTITGTVTTLTFGSGGKYQHNFATGGVVPTATWNANSTVEIVGAITGTTPTGLGQTFGHFTWNPVSQTTAVNFGGTLTAVVGNLTITSTGTGSLGLASTTGPTVTISGNLVVSAGTLNFSTGTVAPTVNVAGSVQLNGGTLQPATSTGVPVFNVGGDWTNNGGTFTPGTGTVTFNGTLAQALGGSSSTTFNNLAINKASGTATLGLNASVVGNLTVTAGTLDLSTFTANRTVGGAGAFTVSSGATLLVGGTANFPANYLTVTLTGSTVNYDALGDQTISAQTYANLITSGSGTKTLAGAIVVTGGLTLGSGTTLDVNASNFGITVGGNWTNNGGTFTQGTGTVTFNGGGAQAINGSAASQTFYNVVLAKSAGTLSVSGSTIALAVNNLTETTGNFTAPASLDIAGTFTLTAGTFTAGANITIGGDWMKATAAGFTQGSGTVTFDGAGAQAINGTSASQTFNNVVIGKTAGQTLSVGGSTTTLIVNNLTETTGNFTAPATLTINGSLTLTAETFTAGAAVSIAGNWTNNGGTFAQGTGTVTFNGTGAQAINGSAASQTFYNVVLTKTTGTLLSVSGNTIALAVNNLTETTGNFTAPATLDIGGTLTLTAGTFTAGANITIGVNWTNNGGGFTQGTGTVTFDGTGTQAINGTSTTQTFNNLTVNKSNTLSVATSTTTLTLTGDLTLTAGTFAAGTATAVNIAGDWTNNGGTFTPGTGTVTFTGTLAQTLGGSTTTFTNLAVNKTGGTATLGVNASVAGNLTVTAGTLDLSTFTANRTAVGGSFTVSPGATLLVGGTANFPTNYTTVTLTGSTVNYDALGAQTISGQPYGNLTTSGSGTKTLGGATSVSTVLTVGIGTTLDASSFILTLSGTGTPFVVNGAFIASTSTVNYTSIATAAANVADVTYYNLTVAGNAGGDTFTALGDITVTNVMTVGLATFNPSSFTITLAGSGTPLVVTGTFTAATSTVIYTSGTGATVTGITYNNLSINGIGTFSLGAAATLNGALSVQGGTFDANAKTVSVAGLTTVSGGSYLASTATQTLTGGLTLSGGTFTGSSGTVAVPGTVTLTSGTLTAPSGTFNVGGNWTNNGGTFTQGTGTVTFNGTGAQAINGSAASQTFYNVVLTKTAGTLLSVSGSTIALAVNNLTETTGNFTAPATLDIGGTLTLTAGTFTAGANITIGVNWTNNGGGFTQGTGTVTFDGTGTQAINGTSATQTFNNVVIGKTAGQTLSVGGSTTTLIVNNLTETTGNFTAPATLTISGSLTLTAGTFTAGAGVSIAGDWTNNGGTLTAGAGTVTFTGTLAQTLGGSTTTTFNSLTVNKASGTATLGVNASVAGNLTVTAGTLDLSTFTANRTAVGGSFTVSPGATLLVGGTTNFPTNYTAVALTGSTVNYDALGAQTISGQTYGNLTTSGSGTKTLGGATTVNTVLTVGLGTTLDASSFILTLSGAGTPLVVSGTFAPSTSTVSYTSGAGANVTGGITYNNLTINSSLDTFTLTGDITVNGVLTISAGTFNASSFAITLAGSGTPFVVTGTFTAATSTVIYTSGTGATVAGTTYNNLRINGIGTFIAGAAVTANGTLNVQGGTFDANAKTVSVAGLTTVSGGSYLASTATQTLTGGLTLSGGTFTGSSGTVTVPGTVTLTSGTLTAPSGTFNVGGNWTNNGGTFTQGTGTVTFNGTGAQAINGSAASQTFYNVVLTKTAGTLLSVSGSTIALAVNNLTETTGNFTAPATLDIGGTLTLTAGTFTAGANITIGVNWTNNGGGFTQGTGTVTFDGTGTQAINGTSATQTFNNVVIGKTAGQTLSVGGSTATLIVNNLTETTGNFTAPATLTINGSLTLTAGTFTAGAAVSIAGDWTNNGGTFTAGASAVSIAGDWTNNGGTFTPGTGTVTFTGTLAQTLGGSTTTFTNLAVNKTGGTATLGVNASVAGNLTVTAGTLDLSTFTANRTAVGGSFTVSPGATLLVGGTANFPTNYTTVALTGSTVNYDALGAQTISGQTYVNLTTSGSGTKTLGGATTVSTVLTVGIGTTLDASSFILTLSGAGTPLVVNGTFAPSTSTVSYTSTAGASIASADYYDLSMAGNSSGDTFTLLGPITVAHVMTQGTGTFNPSSFTITLAGSGTPLVVTGTFTPATSTVFYTSGSGATVAGTTYNNLTTSGVGTFTLGGAATIGGNFSVGSSTTFSTGATNTWTLTAGTTSVSGTLTLANTGTKTFTGNVTINSSGIWNETGIATIAFAGNLQNDGSFTALSGTHTFSGTTKTIGGANEVAIPSLTISGTTTNTGVLTVSTTLAGASTLTNGSNATLNFGGASITPTLTATAIPNTVNYTGTGQTLKVTPYYHLTLSGGPKTFGTITTIKGNLTLSGSATATTAAADTIGGNLSVGSGTTFATGATSTWTLAVTGTTSVSGTLTLATTASKTFTGDVTLNSGGVWNETGIAPINLAGNFTNNATTFTPSTGLHTFSGTGKSFHGSQDIAITNVTITGTYTNNVDSLKKFQSNSGGTLTVISPGKLTQGANSHLQIEGANNVPLNLDATTNVNLVTIVAGGARAIPSMNYSSLQLYNANFTLGTGTSHIYGDFLLGGAGSTLTTVTPLVVDGTLELGDGPTFNAAGFDLTVNGTLLIGGGATGIFKITSATGAKTFTDVELRSGSTFTDSANANVSVKGNWTNHGAAKFTPGSGTITFNGAGAQTINGANTWSNLSVTVPTTARTVSFQSGVKQTVSNSLTFTGTAGNLLTLAPTTPATAWQLNAPATQSVSYVSPSYSNASFGATVNAANGTSTDGGNNTNWLFNSAPTVTTQAVTGIGTTTATGNGNVTALGIPNPTEHGVVWNTTGTPTTADSITADGAVSATGVFTSAMTGLTPGTLYYVRAYATNTVGTSYGGEVTFTTLLPAPTITSFTPDHGPYTTSVTITGTNFTGATAVKFGGTNAATFNVDNATQITATVGSPAPSGVITVTTPGGTATSATNFTVTFTVTSSTNPGTGAHGSIIPLGVQTVNYGDSIGFTGAPDPGYSVLFSVDGGLPFRPIAESGTRVPAMERANSSVSVSAREGIVPAGQAARGKGSNLTDGPGRTYTFSDVIGDHTIEASFTQDTYTVTFISNGGSAVSPITGILYNTAVGTLPADPTRTGYTFDGWFTDDGTFTNAFTATSIVTANVTVYAKWTINTYTVTFNSNGGSAVSPITGVVYNTAVGTLPADPTLTGYTFGGWFTDDGTFTNAFTATSIVTANVTVYAKWTISTYTVTFNSNGGSAVSPITGVVYNTAVGTLPADPTLTGYTFGGWFTDDGTFTNAFTATSIVTANVTVYAKWTINTYTVTFNSNGGSAVSPITGVVYNTAVGTLPADPTLTGYTFGGWFTDDGTFTNAFTATSIVTANVTVYAKWTISTYTVTFNSNGGSAVSPITGVVYNTAVGTLPADPTLTGYTFGGWFTDNGTFTNAFTATSIVTANVTVYAKWTISTYTVTFNSNGGSAVSPITGVVYNTAVGTLPADPTLTGYTFGGWFTDDGTFTNAFTATSIVTANVTVYAKWTINTYTVTFNSNGGSAVSPITGVVYNTAVGTLPADPTLTGYTFGGWFTDDGTFTNAFTATSIVTANVTVYAKWTISTYTVTFNSNGGSAVSPITGVVYNTAVGTLPADPTLTGYTFGGWFTDNGSFTNAFTAASIVTGDITVYAKWMVNTYTLTATAENGTVGLNPPGGTYDYNSLVELTPTATRTGYTFSGWSGDVPTGHENDNPLTVTVNANKSITANFGVTETIAGTGAVYEFDTYGSTAPEVRLSFATLPTSGGTVSVSASKSTPPSPPADGIPYYLLITSSMPNHAFSATVSLDMSGVTGAGTTSYLMFYSTATSSWVTVNGTYSGDDVNFNHHPSFTFTTDHFTGFTLITSATPPKNVYIASGATDGAAGTVYPNTSWGPPTGYPTDWSWTGSQAVSFYVVPELGSVFNAADITLEWDKDVMTYHDVDFSGLSFDTHTATLNGDGNRLLLHVEKSTDITVNPVNYIANVNFRLLKPGHSAVAVVGTSVQKSGPTSVLVLPYQGEVKAYLGDFVATGDESTGDGKVGFLDLDAWSYSYWSGVDGFPGGLTNYKVKYDIGPTENGFVWSQPVPDTKINFEDLVIFAISFGMNSSHQLPKVAAQSSDTARVSLGQPVIAGAETRIPVVIEGRAADVRAMKLEINGQFGSFLGAEKGSLLQKKYSTPVMVMGRADGRNVYVDLAVMGLNVDGIKDSGNVVWLRFTGDPHVRLSSVEGRSSNNNALTVVKKGGAGESVPTAYNLAQNYPNPFNPTTTIEYEIPAAGEVTVEVYNILGARVATLVHTTQEAGFYQVQWNGKGDNNSQVASGVYLYRIHAGQFSSVKKMLLLK